MKGYNYYTITLENKSLGNGVTGGRIDYSPVFCGDCLVPLNECSHRPTEQTNKRRK